MKKYNSEEGTPANEGVTPGVEPGDQSSHSWLTISEDPRLPQTIDITGWGTITKAPDILYPCIKAWFQSPIWAAGLIVSHEMSPSQ